MRRFSQFRKSFTGLWFLFFMCTIANLRISGAVSETLDDQFDERFSFRPSSCSHSVTCSRRRTTENTGTDGNARSGPGTGRSAAGDDVLLPLAPGVGRSGPGRSRSGARVGRSGTEIGRSEPGDGRFGPDVGQSDQEVDRSGSEIGRSEPTTDRSKPEFFGSEQPGTATPAILNRTTNLRVRRDVVKKYQSTNAYLTAEQERLPCYCDGDCTLYGDCCTDGPASPSIPSKDGNNNTGDKSTGSGENLTPSKRMTVASVTTDTFSCGLLNPEHPQFDYKGVYMVSQCPSNAPPFLARKCLKDASKSKYKYMMDVPVVSQTTDLVYANIYCAYCHDDLSFVRYNHSIVCSCDLKSTEELKTMTYEPGNRTWIAPFSQERNCTVGAQVFACVLDVHYPSNVGRHCEFRLIDKCANNWAVEKDRELCQSSNYYVQDSKSSVYKNPICAKCNHVPLNSISCLDFSYNVRGGLDVGGNVFKLSDLFDTNHQCTEDDAVDIIFEECLQIYEQSEKSTTVFDIIYIILMSLSLIAMVLHMAIYILLYTQRNLHTKNLFSMTCSLFGAEFLLLICSHECKSTVGCYISTVIVYYLFMSAFFWMNVMSYDVCKTFRSTQIRSNSHRSYIKYCVYAFGLPALMAAIVVMVDFLAPQSDVSPGFDGFWFSKRGGLLLFFIGPVLVIFLANVAMLVVSMYDIYTHQKSTKFGSAAIRKSRSGKEAESFLKKSTPVAPKDEPIAEASKLNQIQESIKENFDKIKIDKARLVLYSKLALIMGVPWVFALFDNVSVVCKYIFNILNSLQGAFIFLAFDCRSKVLVAVCEKFGWQRVAEYLGSTSSNTASTSGGSGSSTKRKLSSKTAPTESKTAST